ncbi:related to mannan endo-1,6-alpha-mannosidase DCW1 precursor [Cephalotrichum gorgonifer]|uniref:mannan endo-1,6-alpha-mannosidase n=1 Tax=Cephalotrichum gorgonifer TaxID=2041049 RepID=A0AAE8MU81_9PEZI|nr:related to mannan endo-1,6-alpha-mannosidase DCW1 precursor [Cephalotrichum gorgonifer]
MLDPDDKAGVKQIAKDMTDDMMTFYPGNKPGGTPGVLPLPYYWWEAGALMGSLIDYWYYTGDDTWNDDVTEGLLFQVGDEADYMPRNQTHTEGNDDQGFWGLAVMTAAEYKFPDPPEDKPQWLALAQAVFNTQAARWDKEHCDGGLRWQIFSWNNGYDYKNTISQACFFALGARLALYTGNDTYADWAKETWDWTEGRGYIDEKYYVYDGAYIQDGCKELTPYQWTYNIGGFMLGAAAMYNHTEDAVWKERLDGMLKGMKLFFRGDGKDIMTEVACEPSKTCNTDQQSFKAYFSRWLANVVIWYPESADTIMPLLKASSIAAAAVCTGGDNGRMCGHRWNDGKFDGTTGLGQQMAAMSAALSNLVEDSAPPVTADSGGTSKGDNSAGGDDNDRGSPILHRPITAGDRAGAAILTLVVLGGLVSAMWFMLGDDAKEATAAVGDGGARAAVLGLFPALKGGKGKEVDETLPQMAEKEQPQMDGVKGGGMLFTGSGEVSTPRTAAAPPPRQWSTSEGSSTSTEKRASVPT